jgi:predicted ATPase
MVVHEPGRPGRQPVAGEAGRGDFARNVRDALHHLHDLISLQISPLTRYVSREPEARSATLGKALQKALLEAIESLKPADAAQSSGRSTRTYQVLTLRYVQRMDHAEVLQQFGVGESEYHRSQRLALEAVTLVLGERWGVGVAPPAEVEPLPRVAPPATAVVSLPTPLTPFVGRTDDVAAISQRLIRPELRLLTLVGPAGIGKTRLSIQVAREVADRFSDGVAFVPLAPLTDPTLVVPTIVQILGLRETPNHSAIDSLIDHLREKALLLVLDNVEHVVVAAPLIGNLLAACPQLKGLATSRTPLRIYGEHEYAISPLALPSSSRLPPTSTLLDYDAIRLFVERAQWVQSDFALSSENADAVVAICRRLDGLPLAIELAAARIRMVPPAALLDRLSNRLKLLTGGARDLPERQQTLRAAIAWSYDLLSEPEKTLHRRLTVFVDGFNLAAAEAVATRNLDLDLFDGLETLTSQSLLRQAEADGDARFYLLETIREFGQEQLAASGERDEIERAHAAYFRRLAEDAEPRLVTAQSKEWLDRLDRDHDNLRAALSWFADHDGEGGLRLATSLREFWTTRGNQVEARRWLERFLAAAPSQTRLRSQALQTLARIIVTTPESPELLEEALAIERALGDKVGIARTLALLGRGRLLLQDYERARPNVAEALALANETGDKRARASALREQAMLEQTDGRNPEAERLLAEALELERQIGDPHEITRALGLLGNLARLRGDYARAEQLFEEAEAITRRIGDRPLLAWAQYSLGNLVRIRGDLARARALLRDSLVTSAEIGDRYFAAGALQFLGVLEVHAGQFDRGTRLMGAADNVPTLRGMLDADELIDWDAGLAAARTALSPPAFKAAWAEGQAMTLEQAIAFALREDT